MAGYIRSVFLSGVCSALLLGPSHAEAPSNALDQFEPSPAACIARYMLMRNSLEAGSPAEKTLAQHLGVAVKQATAGSAERQADLAKEAQDLARSIHAMVSKGQKTVDDVILETILCDQHFGLQPVFEARVGD